MEKAIKVRGDASLLPALPLRRSSRLRPQGTEGTWGESPAAPGFRSPPDPAACVVQPGAKGLWGAGGGTCAPPEQKMSGVAILEGVGWGVSLLYSRSLPKRRQQLLPDDPLAATALGDLDFTHPSALFETSLLEICSSGGGSPSYKPSPLADSLCSFSSVFPSAFPLPSS